VRWVRCDLASSGVPQGGFARLVMSGAVVRVAAAAVCVLAFAVPGPAFADRPDPAPGGGGGAGRELVLGGESFTPEEASVGVDGEVTSVRLAPQAATKMTQARKGALAELARGARVYGWNQALGPLKDRVLTPQEQKQFQRNIVLSHAAGVGPALPDNVARLWL